MDELFDRGVVSGKVGVLKRTQEPIRSGRWSTALTVGQAPGVVGVDARGTQRFVGTPATHAGAA